MKTLVTKTLILFGTVLAMNVVDRSAIQRFDRRTINDKPPLIVPALFAWILFTWINLAAFSTANAQQPVAAQEASGAKTKQLQQVQFPSGDSFTLSPPTLSVGLTDGQRMEKLTNLSGAAGWKRFARKSVVAPVAIDIKYLKSQSGERIGHSVHAAFVVHASLQTLSDKDLMQQIFQGESKQSETARQENQVSEEELRQHGISPTPDTNYAKAQFALLKKILLRGVIQVHKTKFDDGIDFEFRLDSRFDGPNQSANAWARISKDKADSAASLDWAPYSGAAGYLVVRRLTELDGACLIESRIVLHEPPEWFNGSNLLRSKLPLIIQEAARSFRRKL